MKTTSEAKEDLKRIARFTEKRWGRNQRFLYVKQFDDAFHLLAESTSFGKPCDDIKVGYRKFPQGNHIIFYREISTSAYLSFAPFTKAWILTQSFDTLPS